MAFTNHGHHIPGTPNDAPEGMARYRCGGVGLCPKCSKDAALSDRNHEHKPVQHRDGKLPWCNFCGLTKDGVPPVSPFEFLTQPFVASLDSKAELARLIGDLEAARMYETGRLTYEQIQSRLRNILSAMPDGKQK